MKKKRHILSVMRAPYREYDGNLMFESWLLLPGSQRMLCAGATNQGRMERVIGWLAWHGHAIRVKEDPKTRAVKDRDTGIIYDWKFL